MHPIYMRTADLELLLDVCPRYARDLHLKYRKLLTCEEDLSKGKCKERLTISEYCRLNHEPYEEIYFILRGKQPKYRPDQDAS